jgi:type I restriction enzyme R subunit
MQTIARANRVTSFKINDVEKKNGELIDYYNVFRNMKEALKNYARGGEGMGAAPGKILRSNDVFKNVDLFGKYADRLLTKDEWRKAFAVYENTITSLFEACKPEIVGNPIVRPVAVFQYLRGVVDSIIEQKDIEAVSARISDLLDESVVDGSTDLQQTKPEFVIKQSGRTWDLSKLDFEKLAAEFKEVNYKNIEIADLRAFIQKKLDEMMQQKCDSH